MKSQALVVSALSMFLVSCGAGRSSFTLEPTVRAAGFSAKSITGG